MVVPVIRFVALLLGLAASAFGAGPLITAEAISSPAGSGNANGCSLAASPEGVAWLAWIESEGSAAMLRCATYDPLVRALEAAGIPTFRAADRALHLLNIYCAARQRGRAAS